MGGRKQPEIPDAFGVARKQQEFNRDASRDALAFGQYGQSNPFGTKRYEGEIGSPDRQEIVELNPADQQNLDMQRGFQSQLLSSLVGGQGGGQQLGAGGKGGPGQAIPPMQPQGVGMQGQTLMGGGGRQPQAAGGGKARQGQAMPPMMR